MAVVAIGCAALLAGAGALAQAQAQTAPITWRMTNSWLDDLRDVHIVPAVAPLVPYLLKRHGTASEQGSTPRRSGPLTRFQQGFERKFSAFRARFGILLERALHLRGKFIACFLGFALLSLAPVPFLGRNVFPTVDSGSCID